MIQRFQVISFDNLYKNRVKLDNIVVVSQLYQMVYSISSLTLEVSQVLVSTAFSSHATKGRGN